MHIGTGKLAFGSLPSKDAKLLRSWATVNQEILQTNWKRAIHALELLPVGGYGDENRDG